MELIPATFVKGFHSETSVAKMKYNRFGKTDLLVSAVSLGAGTLSKLYGNLGETDGIKAVHLALKSGINYIDTAPFYGQGRSEEILGLALKDVPRKSYYIATKVGRYGMDYENMFDYSAKKTRQSVEKSLSLLGVDYIDVVQIHDIEFPSSLDVIINETLPTLEALKAEGKLRYIGVSAYPIDILKEIISRTPGRFDTVLCYCRNTLIDDTLSQYMSFFEANNLAVICAAAHGMGLLTNSGPQAWHPAQEQTKTVCKEASNFCQEKGVELGKLALYHSMQMKGPATFLCGMQTESLVGINLDAFLNGLTEKERSVLEYLNKNVFTKIEHSNWEGIEVQRYRDAMQKINA